MAARMILGVVALCFASTSFAYIVDGSRISQPRLLTYAKNRLQNHGTIEQTADGYTYVKVSDSYVTELMKQITPAKFENPRYDRQQVVHGAHISLMYENEAKTISKLQELGQTVDFTPLGFYTVVINDKEYFMLAVDAPELSKIRQKYGLPEKIENHAFHITIGVRELKADNELADPAEVARLNP